jgi:aminopeptidase
LADPRVEKFAQILVDHSTKVDPGDRVAITSTTVAEPLVRALFGLVLDRGGYPHVLLDFPGQEELLFAHASDEQLEYVPLFHKMAFEDFDVLIKIRAETNTRGLSGVEAERQAHRQKSISADRRRWHGDQINPALDVRCSRPAHMPWKQR